VIGRSSYIEQDAIPRPNVDTARRLQLAHMVQPPIKPYLRFKRKARPGVQPMIARRILPQKMVLSVFRQIIPDRR
jgi:hypothetical protein